MGDLERTAGRVRQGTAILREVLGLRAYLGLIPQLRDLLRGCDAGLLSKLADELELCPEVTELVDRALVDRNGEDDEEDHGKLIRAGFSGELDELIASIRDSRRWIVSLEARERERTGIKKLKVGFNKVFGYYIEVTNAHVKLVPDDYMRKQTLVNAERFITPELKEHEARILSAEERIDEMERSIYADVLRQLSVSYPALMKTAEVVAQVDVLLSLAEVAAHQGYVRPVLEVGRGLEIMGGRHPVVEYALDGDVFIPNDAVMEADEGARILLLTGPNMAGKSTYLRQVALITLMAQIGSFVPARKARIGLVDRIFTRVGAQDDIATGKSTFMVEMEETASILHHATRNSLIILDEIGRGTSTYDGLAIARAVVEHLHEVTGARTLFATHYHELASMADELAHLRVYTMAISDDEQGEIIFLHRVTPGCIGRSYGVHVAKLAGMPQSIVRRAEDVLKQLEAGKNARPLQTQNGHSVMALQNGHSLPREAQALQPYAANGNGNGLKVAESRWRYTWQSEAARAAAETLERAGVDGQDADLEAVDICAITPLDALNLLFIIQKKRQKKHP
jgi:DNA mismatch repair protein MutS